MKLDDFGKVLLLTGASEIGQGSETVLAMIVAEELGLPLGRVEVVNSDTSIKPWDVGVHASRTTFIAGNAALLAASILALKTPSIREALKTFRANQTQNVLEHPDPRNGAG